MKKLCKKSTSWLIVLLMIMTMTPMFVINASAAITTTVTLTDGQTLSADAIGTAGGNITVNVPLGATVNVSGTQTILGTVTLTGGGTFKRSAAFTSASMLSVGSGAILNLGTADGMGAITIDGNNVTVAGVDGAGINNSGGTVNIYNGAHITKNILGASKNGAAFYMNDGTINMFGGLIDYNDATSTSAGQGGGGFYISGSTAGAVLNISGGVISYNKTGSLGGGVCIHGGDTGKYAVMNMTGGTISGNYAGRWGGAIEIMANTKLVITGGRIIGNSVGTVASADGGGGIEVDVNGGNYAERGMQLSGNAEFTGNYVSGSGKQSNILIYGYTNIKLIGDFTGSAGVHLTNGNNLGAAIADNSGNYTGASNIFLDAGTYTGSTSSGRIVWSAGLTLSAPATVGFSAPKLGTQLSATPIGAEQSTFQWYRSSTNSTTNTANWVSIPEANSSSYTPVSDDIGKYLICVLDGTGGYTGQQKVVTGAVVAVDFSVDLTHSLSDAVESEPGKGTFRFITDVAITGNAPEIEYFGTYIIPEEIFDLTGTINQVMVKYSAPVYSIANDQTYAADLTDIPLQYFGKKLYAISFIKFKNIPDVKTFDIVISGAQSVEDILATYQQGGI